MGLIGGILQPLYVGRPNILMSPMAFLQKPFRWLSAISRFGATTSGGPNFAYDLCVRKITPEQRATLDLSTWEVAFNGAEPVREDTIEQFCETFAPCGFRREAFYPCFGMAEATLIVSGGYVKKPPLIGSFKSDALAANKVVGAERGREGARGLVGCGGTLRDQEIVIADPDAMIRCAADRVGEIWVRGPSIAQGYWRQPDASEATFQAYLKDSGEGPFLRTGDLGFLQNGELFVTGRIKDLIIFRGVNIYPQDIERTMECSHPSLLPNCGAAFSVEKDGQERILVVQEVERRCKENLLEIVDAIRRAVSTEHELSLDSIVLVQAGSIPKTSSGKIQRHACRNGYLAGTLSVVQEWHADGHTELPSVLSKPKADGGAHPQGATGERASGAHDQAAEKGPARADFVAVRVSGKGIPAGKNGRPVTAQPSAGDPNRIAAAVLEEVRVVARERANGLTLDTSILGIGLDSLERMEILSGIEQRFGGRFPENIYPELETCRDVVAAVENYLGSEPRAKTLRTAEADIPAENYRVARFPEYLQLRERLNLIVRSGVGNPFFAIHEGLTNDRTVIAGREYVNFSSYNYAGMSGDPLVVKAVQEAVAKYGASVSASRLVSGEKDLHRDLERALAQFIGVEDSVVFVSGHATNETVIGHLLGAGDLVVHDSWAHNSILEGANLSGARRRSFAHNDWHAADLLLREHRRDYRRAVIVIEGVYSMDGDIPDLPRFIELKKRHKTLLMIDEAHSMGVLGPTGRGIGEYFHVDRGDVDIWMGTLSKSFGSCGGYIGGAKELVEYLKYTAPGFVYSVGMSPPAAAAALAACRLLAAEPERVARLRSRSQLFLELAKAHGLDTGKSRDSAVVPIILGSSILCLRLSRALFDRGINVQPIVHPAVDENAARLRFFLTSQHTAEQIRYAIAALVEELEKLKTQSAVASRAQEG
jgi:8-amino-7-oxononanoate synthase